MAAIRPGDPAPSAEQEKQIIYWLSRGALPDTALARAGVPRTLFNRWLRAGAEGLEPYAAFTARVEQALVMFECRLLEFVADNANKNLTAATWLFNLRFAPKYKKAADQEAGLEANTPMSLSASQSKEASEEEIEAAERRQLEAAEHIEQNRPKALNFGLENGKTKH